MHFISIGQIENVGDHVYFAFYFYHTKGKKTLVTMCTLHFISIVQKGKKTSATMVTLCILLLSYKGKKT